jgi:hypothetical protein
MMEFLLKTPIFSLQIMHESFCHLHKDTQKRKNFIYMYSVFEQVWVSSNTDLDSGYIQYKSQEGN